MLNIFGSTFEVERSILMKASDEIFSHLKKDFEVNLRFVSEKRITELNRVYRGKNKPTNVLSFKIDKDSSGGDIVICYKEAKRDAKRWGIDPSLSASLLLVHGILHLAGYEHKKTKDRDRMEEIENKIIKKLGTEIER